MSDTPISAMKWKIVQKEEAELLQLKEVEGTLMIHLSAIPKGMSLTDFIQFIKGTGIVVVQ